MELDWITPQQAAQLWGISARRIQSLCTKGRVKGARKLGRAWLIPKDTPKPIDGRTRAARITTIRK
ncbi:helix-turn-helix domain-containing protein [Phosphitispora fastidiosa]|uniref:helix-turn-helix domain-containing protein n=1 Tax=Phosphitispora fastidiosa TaxID=2837202 RepID=UPI001E3C1687|nr:helix-turn-helix domain-containing protein [Phosphitispora fastidiosa]MBU7006877.1 excisionase family DNA binding protein [Phosphitispora fastidiosa]